MDDPTALPSLDTLKPQDLIGKTIFIRCDFNVPVEPREYSYYRVADDTRIRRFLDLTFKKIHDLTSGNCRIIIGSHLGRPHKAKGHSGWDGVFNMQFVCTHFDTLIRKDYGDTYTIFPPEIIDAHLKNSLEICDDHRMPVGGIKFLPNLRFLLDPKHADAYREEFIKKLAEVSDVFVNCAFGTSHRLTRSIKMLPQIMRKAGKIAVGGILLHEEVQRLGQFGRRVLSRPDKTAVIAGGAKIADKIGILKQFVLSGIKLIFIGGKMVNAFLLARQFPDKISSFDIGSIPSKLRDENDEKNKGLVEEVKLAHEILALAKRKNVIIRFPDDYKVVKNYEDTNFEIKDLPDWEKEIQLDLGTTTMENYPAKVLEGIESFFWNGPLGAYDHPHCDHYAKGSMELARLLFTAAIGNPDISVVIGGGDSAAILNKFVVGNIKHLIRKELLKQLSPAINKNMLSLDFADQDTYTLFNYFTSNFFISTGGGAALEFLEEFLKDEGKAPTAAYLPGTATLMELNSRIEIGSERSSEVSPA